VISEKTDLVVHKERKNCKGEKDKAEALPSKFESVRVSDSVKIH